MTWSFSVACFLFYQAYQSLHVNETGNRYWLHVFCIVSHYFSPFETYGVCDSQYNISMNFNRIFVMVVAFIVAANLFAQSNYSQKELNALAKEAEKECESAVKKLEKEKWTFSGVGTLKGAYKRYLLQSKDFGGNAELRSYDINNAPNLRNGEKSLNNQAQSEYAQENEAYLIAEQKAHSGETDITLEDNVIKMLAQFNGDVKRSFIIYKKNNNGTYDMRGYYVIDCDNTRNKLRKLADELLQEHVIGDEIVKRAMGDGSKE